MRISVPTSVPANVAKGARFPRVPETSKPPRRASSSSSLVPEHRLQARSDLGKTAASRSPYPRATSRRRWRKPDSGRAFDAPRELPQMTLPSSISAVLRERGPELRPTAEMYVGVEDRLPDDAVLECADAAVCFTEESATHLIQPQKFGPQRFGKSSAAGGDAPWE